MQIFEALEIREFPYFLTVDATEGDTVKDVINNFNSHKVYLLVDHDTKKIWTYNGPNSSFKLQIYGGILATMLRKQLRLFYRIFSLNEFSMNDSTFQEILEKPLGEGRARTIDKEDFSEPSPIATTGEIIIHNPKLNKAMENINAIPLPENFRRIFLIVGGSLYSEEIIVESFLQEERTNIDLIKMGRLNNGFTFFNDRNYSFRIVVKDRAIQGIELFIHNYDKMPLVELKTPVIQEDKISKEGNIGSLIKAFNIPDQLSDTIHESSTDGGNSDPNKNI